MFDSAYIMQRNASARGVRIVQDKEEERKIAKATEKQKPGDAKNTESASASCQPVVVRLLKMQMLIINFTFLPSNEFFYCVFANLPPPPTHTHPDVLIQLPPLAIIYLYFHFAFCTMTCIYLALSDVIAFLCCSP
jgi:hypothetical protein